ncbi:MAG: hypothetical protein NC489_24045 [Ruminococcus flavefaciens]|nr:hypothetical protein [Ruminococcus flavefaciens]
MKKLVLVIVSFILCISVSMTAFAASWSNYRTTTSSSASASIPTSNQTQIDAAEAEYNSANLLYKALASDRTNATYIAAYALTVGALGNYPAASSCLSHFLDNTGTTYTALDLGVMLRENNTYYQYGRLTNEVNGMMSAMEVFAGPSASLKIVESEQHTDASSVQGDNWFYAIGKYRTWSYFSGARYDNSTVSYSGTLTYHLEDYYDWDPNAGGYFLSIASQALWELHYIGGARNYHISSSINIPLSWNMGQRVGSGVTLSF